VDGSKITDKFPAIVNPVQPFRISARSATRWHPGLWATPRMEGDTFEMEDHRIGRCLYKTYVRPLGAPWPSAQEGRELQAVSQPELQRAAPKEAAGAASEGITVALGEAGGGKLPRSARAAGGGGGTLAWRWPIC